MNLVSARSRKQFLTDKFEYSQYLFALQCKDIGKEKCHVDHFCELES